MNAKLASKQVTIHKAVLLPALVEFEKISVKGPEGGVSKGEQIAGSFYSVVSKELSARGVEVFPSLADLTKDDATRYAVADLQARYDSVAVQLRKKPDLIIKGRLTLGDRVEKFELAADGGADALVFVRGAGLVQTTARKAVSAVTFNWFGVVREFHGELAFVDAKTGEVLAFVRFNTVRDAARNSEVRLAHVLRGAMHDVPLPSPPPKH